MRARTAGPGSSGSLERSPLLLVLVIVCFGAGFAKAGRPRPPAAFQPRPGGGVQTAHDDEPRLQTRFLTTRPGLHTHAACLVELGDGRVRAFWYEGSREGALDVEIRTAVFDGARAGWGEERVAVDRDRTQLALRRYVRKLGNPAAIRTPDGTLWLFYVTVTVGGWGGSSIAAVASRDDGESWGPARRLVSGPFLNLGTMVRGQPFLYGDGTIGVPAYENLLGAYSEVLRVDGSGSVTDRRRLTAEASGVQPVILVSSTSDALALLRNPGPELPRRVIGTATHDAGRHWTRPVRLPLLNPDAALAGVVLPDGRILVALNDVDSERDVLSLVLSEDGGASWTTVHQLENQLAARGQPVDDARYNRTLAALARASDAAVTDTRPYVESSRRFMCWEPRCHFEFSYPFLIQTRGGDFHLVYTWNRSFIKHVQFNRTWLERRLARLDHAYAD
jgi:predicted neuraminidase